MKHGPLVASTAAELPDPTTGGGRAVVALLFVVAMIAAAAWVVCWVGWAFFSRRYDGSPYDPCDTSA